MIIYTDGSCRGNGKANSEGGFGVVILDDNEEFIDFYRQDKINTTNNEMELMAILYVMKNYGNWPIIPTVYSDSSYAVNAFNDWMFKWRSNGWVRAKNAPVMNLPIFKEYYNLYQKGYRIKLHYVKGHNGTEGNELADRLATGAITTKEEVIDFLKKI